MNRSKLVAIITGAISIILAIVYLIIVQLLDLRGEMLPAPQSYLLHPPVIAHILPAIKLLTHSSIEVLSLTFCL